MSKAFTSEETPDEAVLGRNVSRAARGAERPMTPEGYKALLSEAEVLRASKLDDAGKHKLAVLAATLESVRVVEPPPVDGTVRFGSTVTLTWEDGRVQTLRLVGPDEANGAERLSVESPLARVLLEQHEGDEVEFYRPRGATNATITRVE